MVAGAKGSGGHGLFDPDPGTQEAMAINVVMPALEMAQETGKLLAWRKNEGEQVTRGEPLLSKIGPPSRCGGRGAR
jgi:hypothetical protein